MRTKLLVLLGLLLLGAPAAHADGDILVDLSYKLVLNPSNGNRPPWGTDTGGNEIAVTDQDLQDAVDRMNVLMAATWRGYRFRIVEILEVGGQGQFNSGPSQWYSTNFFDSDDGGQWRESMEDDAQDNPSSYQWRNGSINVYLVDGICGGVCSFPNSGVDRDEIVLIGGCSAANGDLQLHEFGHFFSLCHTQGCPCGSCDSDETGQCHTTPGNDNIGDTLPDLECWSQNQIAVNAYGLNYFQLTTGQQDQVDDTWFNTMSYHDPATRLTEQQLDVWSDQQFAYRTSETDGVTWFCDDDATATPSGRSTAPFALLADATSAADANGGDIAMMFPGTYAESVTVTVPITIRATRQGVAVIGAGASAKALADTEAEQWVVLEEGQGPVRLLQIARTHRALHRELLERHPERWRPEELLDGTPVRFEDE